MKMRSCVYLLGLAVIGLSLVFAGCAKKPEVDTTIPSEELPDGSEDRPTDGDPDGSGTDTDPGTAVTPEDLEDVFFDYDKCNLRTEMRRVLDANAGLLKDNPGWNLFLEGHCDERGTVEYNLALGEKRARSVRDYLTQLGISGSRLQTVSYGEERPFDPGHSEAAWAKNRRVHFVQR